jgi:hypothetical protein
MVLHEIWFGFMQARPFAKSECARHLKRAPASGLMIPAENPLQSNEFKKKLLPKILLSHLLIATQWAVALTAKPSNIQSVSNDIAMIIPADVSKEATHDSLLDAASFIATLQKRQGLMVACPEEIVFHQGWINA